MADDDSNPRRWLGDTPMLNLSDDKLRLRVQTVTQFSRDDAERRRAICNYVASIPFNVPPFASMKVTRKTLARRHAVGWYSKAALFEAMLRVAGYPARIRMIRVGPEMYQGLAESDQMFVLPIVEVWTGGRWALTDSYVYDPPYLAAARESVHRRGWRTGYGVCLGGVTDWDGVNDALVMIELDPARTDQVLPGIYDDPQTFGTQVKRQSLLRWWYFNTRNRVMTIRIHREVRRLRKEAGG